ncbi:MAG: hypothetical protein KAJ98_03925 [Spirochaetaceae bacterium]|nr:hypothetical protein [Spirochaetaceae bacterium]
MRVWSREAGEPDSIRDKVAGITEQTVNNRSFLTTLNTGTEALKISLVARDFLKT